jgi:hypothetical protein
VTALGIFSGELVECVLGEREERERERRVLSDFRHVLRSLREIRAQVSGACNRLELALLKLEDALRHLKWLEGRDAELARRNAEGALAKAREALIAALDAELQARELASYIESQYFAEPSPDGGGDDC